MKKIISIIFILLSFADFAIASDKTIEVGKAKQGITWGGEIGSTIDFTSSGMSSIDADINIGYRNKFFDQLGIGAGIHSSLGNNDSFIPVYAIIRTNFSTSPTLCFAEIKGGYSFNSIDDYKQSGLFGSVGLGFNLFKNKKFSSHIILSYNFYKLDSFIENSVMTEVNNLHAASIKIGINF